MNSLIPCTAALFNYAHPCDHPALPGPSVAEHHPGIVLGNAFGSNIANIALILGISAVITPISVQSSILRKELPILSGFDAVLHLVIFAGLMVWTIRTSKRNKKDSFAGEVNHEITLKKRPLSKAVFRLVTGLLLLIASSRLLVWSAIKVAEMLGLSDLIIGLTIVAAGTSLPELASSIIAAKKGEHDIALGNILGSDYVIV